MLANLNLRVAYLCFHVAGRDVELPVLQRLGFEIFTMKKFNPGHRSGYSDFEYDKTLKIPKDVLEYLNAINFIDEPWPDLAVFYLNKYFKYVIVIQEHAPVFQAVTRLKSHILIRLAGLDAPKTYTNVWQMLEPKILPAIYRNKHRVWMSVQYKNLCQVEDPIFSDRSLFMPLGIPTPFKKNRDSWLGGTPDRRIISVLPWLHTNYYKKRFERTKFIIEDRSLLVLGDQTTIHPDTRVSGFLDEDQYVAEFQRATALLYDSREPRHVHYPPIEAAVIGTPVVFFHDSLLGYLFNGMSPAACNSIVEMRKKLDLLLVGDIGFIREIHAAQTAFLRDFEDEFVNKRWWDAFEKIRLSDREPVAYNSEHVHKLEVEHLRSGLLAGQTTIDVAGQYWTTETAQIGSDPGMNFSDSLFVEVRWFAASNCGTFAGEFRTNLETICGQCVHQMIEEMPNDGVLVRQFWRFSVERLGYGWQSSPFNFSFHTPEGSSELIAEVISIKVIFGEIQQDNPIMLDQARRSLAPLFFEGFALQNNHGIDLAGNVGTIFFGYDIEETSTYVYLRMVTDAYLYQEDYTIKISLNGKLYPAIQSRAIKGSILLPVSEIISNFNRLDLEVVWVGSKQTLENMPTLHLSQIEVIRKPGTFS